MLRPLLALLVLALPALAAPVPKGVKKPAVPSLAGTRWEGVHTGAGIGTAEYEFRADGVLAWTKRGGRADHQQHLGAGRRHPHLGDEQRLLHLHTHLQGWGV